MDTPVKCDSCNAIAINGVGCHETGCLDSWLIPDGSGRPQTRYCRECGVPFKPSDREQEFCADECARSYFG